MFKFKSKIAQECNTYPYNSLFRYRSDKFSPNNLTLCECQLQWTKSQSVPDMRNIWKVQRYLPFRCPVCVYLNHEIVGGGLPSAKHSSCTSEDISTVVSRELFTILGGTVTSCKKIYMHMRINIINTNKNMYHSNFRPDALQGKLLKSLIIGIINNSNSDYSHLVIYSGWLHFLD